MRGGRLLKRAGREFVRNLGWMLAVFGTLAALLIFGVGLPPLGVLAFVGLFVCFMATIVTVVALWGGAPDEALHRSNRGASDEGGYYVGGSDASFLPRDAHGHGGGDFGGGGDGGGW